MLLGDRQHAARARRRVVDGANHARLGQRVVVLDEQQVHHQADDLARREVLAGRLVRELGEPADQLLEDQPHLGVADRVGMQVDVRELLGDEVKQVRLREPVDLHGELEALEDVPDSRRERLERSSRRFSRDVVAGPPSTSSCRAGMCWRRSARTS